MRAWSFAVAVLGAGLLGAIGTRLLVPPPEPPPGAPSSLEARLDVLEAQVALLAGQLRRSGAPAPPALRPEPAPQAPPSDAAPGGDRAVLGPEIAEMVRAEVETIAREEREARERRALEEQVAGEQAWLAKTAADLGLTENQKALLSDLIVRRREFLAAQKASYAARGEAVTAEERAQLARAAEEFGRQLDTELRAALSPEQYEALMHPRK